MTFALLDLIFATAFFLGVGGVCAVAAVTAQIRQEDRDDD